MRSIVRKVLIVAIFTSLVLTFLGCNGQAANNAGRKEPTHKAAWLAYWEIDAGEKDLEMTRKSLEKVSYFGAFFNENNHLFVPQELSAQKSELKKKKVNYETYLTFINDKQNSDGSFVLKDKEIVRKLFATEKSMEKHIDEIIALTLQGGYDGVEIDYEKIWKDEKIWNSFIKFTDKLYTKALKNNLKVRIVLEPGANFSSPALIKGPEYVVMVYNLYGTHSDPGPKANREFIQKSIKRMKDLPGEKSVAFSTGGCLWGDNGEKRFLTEIEAKTFAAVHDAEEKRDKESQCLVFSYKVKDVSYEVWYADVETLNYWISIAKEQGENNISIWRLGGNVDIDKIE